MRLKRRVETSIVVSNDGVLFAGMQRMSVVSQSDSFPEPRRFFRFRLFHLRTGFSAFTMRSLLIILASFAAVSVADLVDCDILRDETCIPKVFGASICCGPAGTAFLSCTGGTVLQNDCDSLQTCADGAAGDGGALCVG